MLFVRSALIAVALGSGCWEGGGVLVDLGEIDLVVFQDPDSDFETTEVYEVEGEVVSFSTDDMMVWPESGMAWPEWPSAGNALRESAFFTVRFGTQGGERRAFFTETAEETICNIRMNDDRYRITSTRELVPQE